MTREEAIDILKCLAYHSRPEEESVESALDTIQSLEERKQGEWIDINENLPLINKDILVCDCYGGIYLTRRIVDGQTTRRFYDEYGNKIKDVVAWMELPKPYKADMRGEIK